MLSYFTREKNIACLPFIRKLFAFKSNLRYPNPNPLNVVDSDNLKY